MRRKSLAMQKSNHNVPWIVALSCVLTTASAWGLPGVSCTVNEDFESGAVGWVNDTAATCATGDYVAGNPINVPGGVQCAGSHSGVTSVFTATNNSAGVDDVDHGNCILGSPTWSVANASTLSVWYWHGQRDSGDDASGDFFLLEYSLDGGASWTTIASNGDAASNPVWTEATASIPAGSNVQLRMQCSDGADAGDIIECGIDDVSICGDGPLCNAQEDCDDGLYCNGTETCDSGICRAGSPPSCNDGVACTDDACNEATDSCDNTPNDGLCDNGVFCDGAEACNPTIGCEDGPAPCDCGVCNETEDHCETTCGGGCWHSADFESGADGWTGGADSCTTGSFVVGTPDPTAWQVGVGNPGQAFFTQPNPGGIGTDDVDGGTCEALSPVVDCNGQDAAAVTLDYFHGQRDAGDDANDGFAIEVLNDGVVVDSIVAIGDVTNNPAWTTVSTTVANPGNLQVRVRATDAAGAGDIVEAGIDNVWIHTGEAPPQSCPTVSTGAEVDWRQVVLKDPADECPPAPCPWTVEPLFKTSEKLCIEDCELSVPDELQRFCVYTFPEELQVTARDLDALDRALSASCHHPDLMVVSPAAQEESLASQLQPYLQPLFLEQAGAVCLPESSETKVRLVLVDNLATTGTGIKDAPEGFRSGHGKTLRVFAEMLLYDSTESDCPASQNGARPVRIESQLALPFTSLDANVRPEEVSGGFLGLKCGLAEAVWKAVTRGCGEAAKTILNLSLGWRPDDASEDICQDALFSVLHELVDRGVLVIAASGNKPDEYSPIDTGPLLPAAWENCSAASEPEFGCIDEATGPYRPLVYAAAGTSYDGRVLSNARSASIPPLVAYGDHALIMNPVTGELTENLTGSSVATLVVSAAAAAVWQQNTSFSSGEVMDEIYNSADCIREDVNCLNADFCLKDASTEEGSLCVNSARDEVRRVKVCEGLKQECMPRTPDLSCFHPPNPAPISLSRVNGSPMTKAQGLARKRWTTPQPDSSLCPNCIYDPTPLTDGILLHGRFDPSFPFNSLNDPTLTCGGETHYRLPPIESTGRFDYFISCNELDCCDDLQTCCENPELSAHFSTEEGRISVYSPFFVLEPLTPAPEP